MDQKAITTAKAVYRINQVSIGIWGAVFIVFLISIDSQSLVFFRAMLLAYFSSFILLIVSCVFAISGLVRTKKIKLINDSTQICFGNKLQRVSNILLLCSLAFFVFFFY